MKTKSMILLSLLVVSMFSALTVTQTPEVKAQETTETYTPSVTTTFFDKPIDWTTLWLLFNQYAMWDLEWYSGETWFSVKSDLTIRREYPEPDRCKITLIFESSLAGDYRLTFGIDKRVKKHVTKLDKYQYELEYEGLSVVFNWSDVMSISGLQISHGIKNVEGIDYFWFRMRKNNIPQGAYVEIDPTIELSTDSITSIHTCSLDTSTFIIAYHDEVNDDYSFQIYDTNGTQILAETDVDTTSGGGIKYTSIGVSAFNSTTFVIGWYDKTDQDATFAVYDKDGTLLTGPTDADTATGGSYGHSVQVSCFNSTHFVISWADGVDYEATFSVYDSDGNLKAGPIVADGISDGQAVSVSCFNSTHFVIGWFDNSGKDATFAIYDSTGANQTLPIHVEEDIGASRSVSVSAFNSTHFVIGWYAYTPRDVTFAIYNSDGTLLTGPTDADSDASISYSVQVSVLNSTAFVISWRDYDDHDLSYATYLSNGTAVKALTDIETWATAVNNPFMYQSPCSQESGTGIGLDNDNWVIAYANTTTQAIWRLFSPSGTFSYELNLRTKNSAGNVLTDTTVYINNGTEYSGTVDDDGWKNFTGQDFVVVEIKVKYQNSWVNGTFSVTMDADKTVDVTCEVYSLTAYITDIHDEERSGSIMTLTRTDGTNLTDYDLTPKTATYYNTTHGVYVWTQLANQTSSYTVTADYGGHTKQSTTTLTSDTEIEVILPGGTEPGPGGETPSITYDIQFYVYDLDHNPLGNVSITIIEIDMNVIIFTGFTDIQGFSEIFELEGKSYEITFSYQDLTETEDIAPTMDFTYQLQMQFMPGLPEVYVMWLPYLAIGIVVTMFAVPAIAYSKNKKKTRSQKIYKTKRSGSKRRKKKRESWRRTW